MARSNWTPLHARLHRTLRSRHLLERNQRLLVAVSGGQDSLCLIQLLLDLQPKWGWQLGMAHCDHRWRPDSYAAANHVEQLANNWKILFYRYTAEHPLKSEAAARQWRYQALSAIAQENGYNCILTGHTKSDRAETLLYNLIRGSGADGLQALTWKRSLISGIELVRPLLEITRSQTAQFCQDMQLAVWEDSTNQDLKYARNRIRQELLPYLQTHFNPQVEQALAQTSELLQAEVEYLELAAQQLLKRVLSGAGEAGGAGERRGQGDKGGTREQGESSSILPPSPHPPIPPSSSSAPLPFKLNRRVLQTAPLALQRRVMRQVLQQVLPCNPSFDQIEKMTALITAPNRSRTDPFPGGAIAEVDGDWIWLKQSGVQPRSD